MVSKLRIQKITKMTKIFDHYYCNWEFEDPEPPRVQKERERELEVAILIPLFNVLLQAFLYQHF